MTEFNVTGIELKGMIKDNEEMTALDILSELNKGEYLFSIYDGFDEVHNRESLVVLELEEIEDNIGVEKVFVMGHFNKQHKEMLKLSNELLNNIMGIEDKVSY